MESRQRLSGSCREVSGTTNGINRRVLNDLGL